MIVPPEDDSSFGNLVSMIVLGIGSTKQRNLENMKRSLATGIVLKKVKLPLKLKTLKDTMTKWKTPLALDPVQIYQLLWLPASSISPLGLGTRMKRSPAMISSNSPPSCQKMFKILIVKNSVVRRIRGESCR